MTTDRSTLLSAEDCLPGRDQPIRVPQAHHVNGHPLQAPFPNTMQQVIFGLGCFWGAERRFWQQSGVYSTAVGYAGGHTINPSYEEVCSGLTAHTEVVLVVFDPAEIDFEQLLRVFWESHDPTQGMRQGNDRGSQYRSAIYCDNEQQLKQALDSRESFQRRLEQVGLGPITSEISLNRVFYYAEEYHQQYLSKNPAGYCGLRGTGVTCG
ncbi:peptide-methionine (S)-S-oxide reductase MsrA [Aestuariirhabdus sp. Z084]|uniref:peptide-methionine (S)-S-oxide reductase MsrA n=1 Tax=Aestuariirhabdus haliotis TaxID=2918751 RepID=UPI00201B3D32|nr:peptide-methionine (S)-S-oxide reductase MsrA [Aestuariirhabdus haliotis]MCL6417026.1 peptide-methionine (S)-S-oxide reductase MsrA [Aestuariirhabdus haliotis]MCL6421059.1 peptide-methionine (S)-S-oxide reductase MsrA [Aestuariirhabdus haliotis]